MKRVLYFVALALALFAWLAIPDWSRWNAYGLAALVVTFLVGLLAWWNTVRPIQKVLSTRGVTQILLGAVLGSLLGVSLPVAADHVSEPTAPVEKIELHLYQYPNPQTTTLACDGSDVVTFSPLNLRVEGLVYVTGAPSEHWDERLTLYVVENRGTRFERAVYDWDVTWRHSNVPPHHFRRFESHQTNQKLDGYRGEDLRFVWTVTGLESDVTFEASCTFTVG